MAERNNEWDLPVPCGNCPFRKEGAIKLRPGRLKGIIRDILSDEYFRVMAFTSTRRFAT